MMHRRNLTVVMVAAGLFTGIAATAVSAQAPLAESQAESSGPMQVRVHFTVERLDGDRVVSSMPLELLVKANLPSDSKETRATLNHGVDVAVPQATQPGDRTSYQYRRVGTNISVPRADVMGETIALECAVEISSIETEKLVTPVAGAPLFRSFHVSSSVLLRPGETVRLALGSDRITGESVRLSVRADVVR